MSRPIVLFENMRAIPYVPFYLAAARNDWERAGAEVRIETSPATSQTAAALLDGRADVSWGGPMRVMLHHNADPDCPLVCFGQVVSGEPFVLVGRKPIASFRLADLLDVRIGIAVDVPTPWMTFQDDLRRAGIAPSSLDRAPDVSMAENAERLRNGEVDVIQVFEPYVDQAVAGGWGHVWHRFAGRGDMSYTSFYTTRRFAEEERATCRALVRGIAAAQEALFAETADEIAGQVAGYFPDIERPALARMIEGYRSSGVWARSPELPVDTFVRLKASLLSGGLIDYDAPYHQVVDDAITAEALAG
jgi:NitT/TauT family transport system substrate-binding protein